MEQSCGKVSKKNCLEMGDPRNRWAKFAAGKQYCELHLRCKSQMGYCHVNHMLFIHFCQVKEVPSCFLYVQQLKAPGRDSGNSLLH